MTVRDLPPPMEHDEQVGVIQWWAWACKRWGLPEFSLFAVPNGGLRHPATAGRLRAEGVRPGIHDLILAVPMRGQHGLFVEMKRTFGGRVSAEQKDVSAYLEGRNYRVRICRGAVQAIEAITEYLGEMPKP